MWYLKRGLPWRDLLKEVEATDSGSEVGEGRKKNCEHEYGKRSFDFFLFIFGSSTI